MIDRGIVVSASGGTAEVRVTTSTACCQCSARVFCRPEKGEDAVLKVMNPLEARPGDEVRIEVPERDYTHQMIRLFGLLLGALGAGLGLGVLAGRLFSLPSAPAQFLGLVSGLALGGPFIRRSFRRPGRRDPYPVIVGLAARGENHG